MSHERVVDIVEKTRNGTIKKYRWKGTPEDLDERVRKAQKTSIGSSFIIPHDPPAGWSPKAPLTHDELEEIERRAGEYHL